MSVVEGFGRRVRECRRTNGISQAELSRLLGARQATLSHIERGKCNAQDHQRNAKLDQKSFS